MMRYCCTLTVAVLLGTSGTVAAQPVITCPCLNASKQYGFHAQHWYEQRTSKTAPAGAFELRWVFPTGGSCLSTRNASNCTLCAGAGVSDLAWKWGPSGQLMSAQAKGSSSSSQQPREQRCLTATPPPALATTPATNPKAGSAVMAPCDNTTSQSWTLDRFHQLSVQGSAGATVVCLTAGPQGCAPPPPPAPPSPSPPGPPSPPSPSPPPHTWPAWKPRRFVNAIITRGSWPRYLAALKQYPGSINAVSEYTYEINYYIKANWSLATRQPYGLNFSHAVQKLTPKVAVTPVIAMGGSYATQNFHAAAVFTEVMVAEAV
eukprot:SAG25_NODE_3226_length_1165_cov_2.301126_1_plen_317_part_10